MSEHMGGGTGKIWFSLIFGLFLLVFGGAATLEFFGINLPVPTFFLSDLVVKILLIVAGLLLLVDSFKVRTMMGATKFSAILIGLIMAFAGALPLLIDYKLVGFLPFLMKLSIPNYVLSILLAVYGIFLIIRSIQLYKSHAMGFY
ncbi:MAG: hypothetical protein KJ955_04225 [Nanoarchaeota archaeon]|nr:hypothetical protein [Nanoarchaeota archaeon]